MSDKNPSNSQSDSPQRLEFITYVMSDVYALLDYLSGRARPSLERFSHPVRMPVTGPVAVAGSVPAAPDLADPVAVAAVLDDPTLLLREAMRVGQLLDNKGTIADVDAAFLVRARDELNMRASPATGTTITFTLLVIGNIHPLKKRGNQNRARFRYINQDPQLEVAARQLATTVRHWLLWMFMTLIVTVILSAYVACGKLLLDTRDAVNRDHGANIASLQAALPTGTEGPNDGTIESFCQTKSLSFMKNRSCQQHQELDGRKKDIRRLLAFWIIWPAASPDGEQTEQVASIEIGVIGNYILPVLYGLLGSFGFVLRQFNRQLLERLLSPRESRASNIRLMLGAVSGACIGLFFNSSAGAAQTTGLGGAAVTLTASSIAFLAGYGVEGVFKTLDALIRKLFNIEHNGNGPTAGPAPGRLAALH